MNRLITGSIAFVSLFLVTRDVQAHDCWLFPERFALSPGDTLIVRQVFGHELRTTRELPLNVNWTRRFELITADRSVDLIEYRPVRYHPTRSPLLEWRVDFEGVALLGVEHDFLFIQMSGTAFGKHLEREQLEGLIALRDSIGHRSIERERYARSVKTLVTVGAAESRGDMHKRPLGHTIEITLLQDPGTLHPGDSIDVLVTFNGRPLSGQPVRAQSGENNNLESEAVSRTDQDGVARFKLERAGFWLIRLVYVRPCEGCDDADWESYWASFSFTIR